MADKVISPNSLNNLTQSNLEAKLLTRESLETALVQLMEDKEMSKITISELVNRAGVSRNAFYRHYKSKEDILDRLMTRTLHSVLHGLSQFDLKKQLGQAWTYLLTECQKEAQILKIIFDQNLQDLLTTKVAKRFRAYQRLYKKKISTYASSFFSNAIIAMLGKWISEGMTTSIEELAAMRLPLLPQ